MTKFLKPFFCYLIVCVGSTLHSQHIVDLEWAESIGSINSDVLPIITTDNVGDVYIAGNYKNTVDFDPGPNTFNLTSNGDFDIFIQKLNTQGDLIWAKSIGGNNEDLCFSITTDATGNVYVTGYFRGNADFDPGINSMYLTATGSFDLFILKLDSTGNLLWAKSIGGASTTWGRSIVTDAIGDLYITGGFRATVDFDPGPDTLNFTSSGGEDIFVQKLDSNANLIWVKTMGSISEDIGYSLNTSSDGNIYIAGNFSDTVDFDPGPDTFNLASNGFWDIFIQKLDPSGNFIWAKSMGGAASETLPTITTDIDGILYVTGNFSNTVDFDPGPNNLNLTSNGGMDIFIQKLDANGNLLWVNAIGGIGSDGGLSITTDASNDVYVTGSFQSIVDFDPGIDTLNLISNGESDIFMLKLNPNGNLLWASSMGGSQTDYGNSINIGNSGSIYVTGSYTDSIDIDPGPATANLTSNGEFDIFALKITEPTTTSTGIVKKKDATLYAYPNPTTGILTIEGLEGVIEIYDLYGKLVKSIKSNTLDISQFTNGIYFLQATDEQGDVYSYKIIKE